MSSMGKEIEEKVDKWEMREKEGERRKKETRKKQKNKTEVEMKTKDEQKNIQSCTRGRREG